MPLPIDYMVVYSTGVFSMLRSVGATDALSIAGTCAVVGAGVRAAMERA